ncbi:MAG: metallopeptidase TldD-related protein [Bryobacteraceae bacterium]|nr:metallopeptidase TldD-related protein [Bryobacteraceae bacterium]
MVLRVGRIALAALSLVYALPGQTSAGLPPLAGILDSELARNFSILSKKSEPVAYYIAYSVSDEESGSISAVLGGVTSDSRSRRRIGECTLRVGTPSFDNFHVVDGERPTFTSSAALPIEDDPAAIRLAFWRMTDAAQRSAVQLFQQVQTAVKNKQAPAHATADFSLEPATTAVASVPVIKVNGDEWKARLRKLSLLFKDTPAAIASTVSLSWRREVKTLVNSEGTKQQHGRTFATLTIVARGKAMDGEDLVAHESFDAEDPARLPKEDVLAAAVRKAIATLEKLRNAPQPDPFVGPAILSGRAAGVFFHEIFGHRIEGHRQSDLQEGQTFSGSIGKPVLPEFLTVVSDPTVHSAAGEDLNGWYDFDDEGVAARRVMLVENGILKTFLLSRTPAPGFDRSNGHGRKQPGYEAVSRQSNLFVLPAKTVSETELRKMLLEEAKRQGKAYGLYFDVVTGGYTQTRRESLQSFTVIPLVVYRVYADGRPDELVRGVDIVGTPLSSFARIIAAANKPGVFNGYCGAESGQVPVSAISPALLVSEIEIQRKRNTGDRPPLLPRPIEGDTP